MLKKAISKDKALERLTILCNRSEQCESDLMRKLVNWGISSADRREILETLKEERLLDEGRYARAYAGDKARFSSWGPRKIHAELAKRRIAPSLIKEALQNIEPEIWKEGLLRCAQSKAKNLDLSGEEGFENRQKLFRFLIGRGFSSDAAGKAVNKMKKNQEEEK